MKAKALRDNQNRPVYAVRAVYTMKGSDWENDFISRSKGITVEKVRKGIDDMWDEWTNLRIYDMRSGELLYED